MQQRASQRLNTLCFAGLACSILLIGNVGCSQFVADQLLRPPLAPKRMAANKLERQRIARDWGDHLREFNYTSMDGTRLAAAMLTPRVVPQRGVVVLIHGLTDSKEAMLPYAAVFAEAGYVAVCPDLRAHGKSGGRYTTMGAKERWDMLSLLDHLERQGYDVHRVGALGGSLGAATAIQWAGMDPRVKAVIAVAPFADLRTEIQYQMKLRKMDLPQVEQDFIQWACQREGDFKLAEVKPINAVRQIDTPIFFLRGDKDKIIPPTESDRLFEAARGPTVIERIANAGHMNVVRLAGDQFMRRAVDWVDAFVPEGQPQVAPAWARTMAHRNIALANAQVQADVLPATR